MNSSMERLAQIAAKPEKLIIGLMSGTSLDGLDIALCKIMDSGSDTALELQAFKTVTYPEEVRADLQKIVSVEEANLQEVCLWHSWLGDFHADLIIEALREWEIELAGIDCIASHGQTIYHAPKAFHERDDRPNATLQIIDGDHLARETGILTISDFRQKHTAAGGEGAPMVALIDEMLFTDEKEPRLLLNIGGIANFTYLPARETGEEIITTDVGPGNTLIDHATQQLFEQPFDEDGAIAQSGTVQPKLLKALLAHDFFSIPLPRTTGPELFNLAWVREVQQKARVNAISNEDLIATLTWVSAQTIANAILEVCGDEIPEVYLSGGGMHNTQLVNWIEELLEKPTHSFEEIGFNPDAKEAACFAILANEMLSGEGFIIKPKQNAGRRVNFGKISLPI